MVVIGVQREYNLQAQVSKNSFCALEKLSYKEAGKAVSCLSIQEA